MVTHPFECFLFVLNLSGFLSNLNLFKFKRVNRTFREGCDLIIKRRKLTGRALINLKLSEGNYTNLLTDFLPSSTINLKEIINDNTITYVVFSLLGSTPGKFIFLIKKLARVFEYSKKNAQTFSSSETFCELDIMNPKLILCQNFLIFGNQIYCSESMKKLIELPFHIECAWPLKQWETFLLFDGRHFLVYKLSKGHFFLLKTFYSALGEIESAFVTQPLQLYCYSKLDPSGSLVLEKFNLEPLELSCAPTILRCNGAFTTTFMLM